MSEFINTIDKLGDEVVFDSIISKSITEFQDNVVTGLSRYAFERCSNLTIVDLPNATSVGGYVFRECTNLVSLDLPNATSVGGSAFSKCENLISVNLPLVEDFYGSSATSVFSYCKSLKHIKLPSVTRTNTELFAYCTSLKTVDLGVSCSSVYERLCEKCSSLTTFVLRNESKVAQLRSTNAFNNTPIANGIGYIYVPRALLSDTDSTKDYRQATNWSTYAAQFRALEDYTVDGTIMGELDETKI